MTAPRGRQAKGASIGEMTARPGAIARKWGFAALLSLIAVWLLLPLFGWLALAATDGTGSEWLGLFIAYLGAGACSGVVALRVGPARDTRIQRCFLAAAAPMTWLVAYVAYSSAPLPGQLRMVIAKALLRDFVPVVLGALVVAVISRPTSQRTLLSKSS